MNVGGRRFLPWGSLLLLIIAWGVLTLASIPYRPSLERLNEVQVDEPAPLTVYAPFSFKAANETETAKRRLEAEKSVPPTFKRIPDVVETADRKWKALVQISKTNNPKIWDELADVDVTDASRAARDFWNENLTPRERSLLGLKVADTDWCSAIQSILIKTLQDQELLLDQREVEVLHPTDGQQWVSWKLKDLDGISKERISGSTVFAVTEEVRRLSKRLAESDFGKIE
jgi:membrane-associated HD superfamily phosphohydrolase